MIRKKKGYSRPKKAFELSRIKEESEKLKRLKLKSRPQEGICEECGNYSSLFSEDGELICGRCIKS